MIRVTDSQKIKRTDTFLVWVYIERDIKIEFSVSCIIDDLYHSIIIEQCVPLSDVDYWNGIKWKTEKEVRDLIYKHIWLQYWNS